MQVKVKIKIIKYHKNLFYIVVALNKRSLHSRYIDKIGLCFFSKSKKIIMLSLKKLSYWLNKGVKINPYVSYIFAIIFKYYLRNKINNKLKVNEYDLKKTRKLKRKYNSKIINHLVSKKNKII